MSHLILRRFATNLRARPLVSSRCYSSAGTRPTPSPTYKRSTTSTPAARASTNTSDTVPTAQGNDVPSTAYSAQPESVPSSSTNQQPSTTSSVDFADSTSIGGSPNDPSTPDWSRSYFGLSSQPFPEDAAEVLLAPVDTKDVEIKPDGLIYLPEIKYRRVLNKAFGPGGWGLAPRSETFVGPKVVSREYALVCLGRLVGIARGEQEFFDQNGIATATEACKSNALMRCCKDLGIASELWDPRFIREFKAKHCVEVFAEDARSKTKKKLWRRKDQPSFGYPYKEL